MGGDENGAVDGPWNIFGTFSRKWGGIIKKVKESARNYLS